MCDGGLLGGEDFLYLTLLIQHARILVETIQADYAPIAVSEDHFLRCKKSKKPDRISQL